MARPVRHQSVDIGGIRAVKHGAPWGPGDIYYELMEMGWRAFVGVVSMLFVIVNAAFGAIYALVPNAIDHLPAGSFLAGFFFSVETMTTVGYGEMAPATTLGHAAVTVEILTGLFLIAMLYGLIFQRFARPREGMMFSDKVVVTRVEGQRVIMFRIAGTRARPLADVAVEVGLLKTFHLPSGREYRRNLDLRLRNPRNAMMALAWTLVHDLDDDSELGKVIDGDEPLRITVTVRGLDTLLSNPIFASHAYRRDDLRHDHDFVDIFDYHDDGSIHLDLTRLHETHRAEAEQTDDDGAAAPADRAEAAEPATVA